MYPLVFSIYLWCTSVHVIAVTLAMKKAQKKNMIKPNRNLFTHNIILCRYVRRLDNFHKIYAAKIVYKFLRYPMLIKNFRRIPKIEKIYANAVCLCYMPINSNLGFSFFYSLLFPITTLLKLSLNETMISEFCSYPACSCWKTFSEAGFLVSFFFVTKIPICNQLNPQ